MTVTWIKVLRAFYIQCVNQKLELICNNCVDYSSDIDEYTSLAERKVELTWKNATVSNASSFTDPGHANVVV